MLGSVHDANDALLGALLRGWRGLPGPMAVGSGCIWSRPTPAWTWSPGGRCAGFRSTRTPAGPGGDGLEEPLAEPALVELARRSRAGV